MSSAFALSLGILFFVLWVSLVSYVGVLRRIYTMGRTDQISKVNRKRKFKGLSLVVYNAGRRQQAEEYKYRVHKTGRYRGYPTAHR